MNLQTAIVEDSKPDAERLKQLLKRHLKMRIYPAAVLPAEMNFCGPAGAKGIR